MLIQTLTEERKSMERKLNQTEEAAKLLAHQVQMLTEEFEEYKLAGRMEGKLYEQLDQVFLLDCELIH